jgi:hypothetical protein
MTASLLTIPTLVLLVVMLLLAAPLAHAWRTGHIVLLFDAWYVVTEKLTLEPIDLRNIRAVFLSSLQNLLPLRPIEEAEHYRLWAQGRSVLGKERLDAGMFHA